MQRGIWLAAAKALMWVKDVLRFCYLNIPCLRINSTLIFMSSSNDEVTYFEDRLPVLGKGEKIARRQGPEEMCLALEHQHPSKTTLKNGLF